MSAEIFARRWVCMLVLLGVLIVASPWIVDLLVRNSECFGSQNACGDMADVYAHYGRSLILVITLLPLVVTLAGRTLAAGVFAWAFPFGMLMLAGALPLFYALGQPGTAGWQDIVAHPAFAPLLFLLVLLVALSVGGEDEGGRVWRVLMGVVAFATLFLTWPLWLPGFALLPYAGRAAPTIAFYLGEAHAALGLGSQLAQLANLCLIGFVLTGAGMMVSTRARRNAYA